MKRLAVLVLGVMLLPAWVLAHCEIPCGIYGDEGRFSAMMEDVTTIEKAMTQINDLSGAETKNFNQIVRWVNNKEVHADKIRDVVSQYFLAQRIKEPADGDVAGTKAYTAQLVKLHHIIRMAMKCKQTTDVANAQKLHDLIHEFQALYNAK